MTLADDVDLEEYVMSKVRTNHKLRLKSRLTWYPVQHDLVKQSAQDELSGADIKAICTEAGLLALRERRMKVGWLLHFLPQSLTLDVFSYPHLIQTDFEPILLQVTQEDFKKSKENVLYRKQEGTPEGLYM